MSEPTEKYYSETTEDITNKKCPQCGATITFNPASGKLHCDYCGYECELPNPDDGSSICEMDFNAALNRESYNWG